MKKLSLSYLNLDLSKLSNEEKKLVTGGFGTECMVRCKCPGEPEKWVPRGQCNTGQMPMCLESMCPDEPIIEW